MSRWFQLVLLNDAINNDDCGNVDDDEGTDDDDDNDDTGDDDDDSVTDAALTRLRTRRNFLISWTDRFSKFEISKAVPFFHLCLLFPLPRCKGKKQKRTR